MKQMSELEIADRLSKKKAFNVKTANDRQKVLNCAKFLGVKVATRQLDKGTGFAVAFLEVVQNS